MREFGTKWLRAFGDFYDMSARFASAWWFCLRTQQRAFLPDWPRRLLTFDLAAMNRGEKNLLLRWPDCGISVFCQLL
jgi:hypothetical protein